MPTYLLVTHWPVESASARQLVSGTFERYANRSDLTRAQALRQAMVELMEARMHGDGPAVSYAHPLFWAPYALVEDAAR
ncbi:MAG: CHAT domain-containing protein [Betaproteobacteria bacterium]|nr:CHAT domain-containing protein [Betaproteobacteria bacterium]